MKQLTLLFGFILLSLLVKAQEKPGDKPVAPYSPAREAIEVANLPLGASIEISGIASK